MTLAAILGAWVVLGLAIALVAGRLLRKRRELDELLQERYANLERSLRDDLADGHGNGGECRGSPRS
jgi:hypothetical protein